MKIRIVALYCKDLQTNNLRQNEKVIKLNHMKIENYNTYTTVKLRTITHHFKLLTCTNVCTDISGLLYNELFER